MKTTLKFTRPGRQPIYGRSDYPDVGVWSERRTPELCVSGWHVHTDGNLSLTLGAEMWVVEVDGLSTADSQKEAHERIRFVRKVEVWDPAAFTADCVAHAQRCAASVAAAFYAFSYDYAATSARQNERKRQSDYLREVAGL